MKALVIDDDTVSRKTLCHSLSTWGFETFESPNGRHGWETLWENREIDIVITDMVMPDMDGRELVHLIRKEDCFEGLPIIIVSGVFSSEELEPIITISPTQTLFLAKPIDTLLFREQMGALLSKSKQQFEDSNLSR